MTLAAEPAAIHRPPAARWDPLAQALHWLMALGLVGLFGVGLWMTGLPLGMRKLNVYALHKSVGLTLLALAAVRLAWRAVSARPGAAPGVPRWQTLAARGVHALIYVLLFAIPLSGWLYNSAAGFPLRWFRVANLPALAAPDPELKALAHSLHEAGAWTLAVLVALHAAAALKHHFVDRDRTLLAMLPARDSTH